MISAEKFTVRPIILRLEPVELADLRKFSLHIRAIKVVIFSFGLLFVLFISTMLLFTHFINIFHVKVYLILTQFDVFIIRTLLILLPCDTTSKLH